MKIKLALIVLSSVFILTSCNNEVKNETTKNTSTVSKVVSSSDNVLDHHNFTRKYNQYIDFQNRHNKSLNKNLETYYKSFDPAKPVMSNNRPIIWSYSSSVGNLERGLEAEPKIEDLDKDASILLKQAKKLDSLLTLSSFYYSKKQFEEDNFKRGQELSNLVEPAVENYYETYSSFATKITSLANELTQRDLISLKDKGNLVRYNMLSTIVEAEKLVNYIYANSENNCQNLDTGKLENLLKSYNEPLTALEQLSLDKEAVKKELDHKSSTLSSVLREASILVINVKKLKERKQNNDWKFSPVHPNIPSDGSVEKISKVYSEIIRWYNMAI